MTDTELIQRFVDCFTRLDESAFSHDDPAAFSTSPEALVSIRRCGVLPELYEQLATSYRLPEVEIGVARLLPNLPAENLQPLADSMFADPVLNNTLVSKKLVRFAMAPNYCYDPICFDLNRFSNADCPVVRINHESVLSNGTVGEVEAIFDSFRDLMLAVLAIENQP